MLRIIEAYVFIIARKFPWKSNPVMTVWVCWENHRILSTDRRGDYWEQFVVVFHSQFNRIIIIISADGAECGLLNTEIHIL